MNEPPSTKPYLLRAIYDWCVDAGFTPYVAVAVDETVQVPPEFVRNGEIILNISALATNRLKIDNQAITFQARFGGVPRDVYVPIARVIAIYARENGQGMAFEVPRSPPPTAALPSPAAAATSTPATPPASADGAPPRPPRVRPHLTRVK
ncbi:MAG: ClpXP protease specificity-enhancing factor [Sutterellaceae bacterium]|nr:ClpXP protease specificity-enhancing factor [Burkholderiaceae bacterium]MCX7901570.1 ClpXP protease specificity-enhancing factor [Burkholderiaceae bacterium]MDW8430578.1 ClpXP protease specificity-enhancing factor [Sutterellaceae bacterium]